MNRTFAGILAAAALVLTGCGGDKPKEWQATDAAHGVALDDCDDQVDALMQVRGYPLRPGPGTPQHGYREAFFAKCMSDKGYAAE